MRCPDRMHEDTGVRTPLEHVSSSARVIEMDMRQHEIPHLRLADAELAQRSEQGRQRRLRPRIHHCRTLAPDEHIGRDDVGNVLKRQIDRIPTWLDLMHLHHRHPPA